MAKPNLIRSDFAEVRSKLVGETCRQNFDKLYEWLKDVQGLVHNERAITVSNFNGGGLFGSFNTGVVLVTNARLTYTARGSDFKSYPLKRLDTDHMNLKSGLVNGTLQIQTTDGELLTFKNGTSLMISEVAHTLIKLSR